MSTWITAVLASLGPLLYTALRRRAEKLLRKEQLAYQQALRSISSTMMLNKDLDKLLNSIVLNVVDIVKVEWAAVYLKDDRAQKYFLRHQRSQAQSLIIPAEFTPDSEFIKHLFNSRLPLIGEEFHSGELKVGLAVPCFLDSNMVGFLLLGNKPKGVIYDQSDVNEFTLLANQIALAIENCQFYTKERQQEHSRRLSSLDNQISWMAHEMDNPIHATLSVLGTIDIALDELVGTIPSDKMEYLKQKLSRVEFNAGRVSKMISAVKEFTKPTTGQFIPVTLQQIIASFEAILQPQIRHFGIDFTVNLPAEPVWLRVNKVEIEQVLVNLGTNSVQAINELWQDKRRTTQGEKMMVLTAYKMENKVLRIDLKDTGGGIEDKLLEDIFLDFVTTKASTVGTGLGLAIARKIISRHKGKIWAESQGPGSGATFHIELPVAEDITEEEKTKFSDGQNESKRRDMI